MNYQKIYNDIILRATNRLLEDYTESHHIIPKCMGGTDDTDNLVDLTPEEHYVAHQLLVKMYPKNKALVNAAAMMIPNRPSNKMYGWLKRKHSVVMSEIQSGEKNSQYGTRWVYNEDLRKSMKIPKADMLPEGWKEGRVLNFDAHFEKINRIKTKPKQPTQEQIRKRIKTKHFMFRKTEGYRKAKSLRLYKEFRSSGMSLRKFALSKDMTPMTLSNWFNQFVPEYDIVARTAANKQVK